MQSHSVTPGCLDSRSLNFSLFSLVLHLFSIEKIDFNFLITLLLAIIFVMVSCAYWGFLKRDGFLFVK